MPAHAEDLISGSGGSGGLIHAKSEMDLTRADVDVDVNTNVRPGGPLRRRSTRGNPLGLESPMARQKRLEDVTAGRMADVFFSLDVGGGVGSGGESSAGSLWWEGGALIGRSDDPIYISEVVSKSMVWSSATRGFLKRGLMGEGFYRIRIFSSSSCRITGRTFPGWIRPL